jgi:transcriptional regulator with XRE-family HTH domain
VTGPDRVAFQVGNALRRLREERNRQYHRVADAAGISRRQLVAFEEGQEQPSIATLTALLRALDCSADEFGALLGPWGLLRA